LLLGSSQRDLHWSEEAMGMDETFKIWMKSQSLIQKVCIFNQKRAIPSLDFVVIQQFHSLKKDKFIAKYSLQKNLYHF
jgi:hypothetical protein